jgi:hypothetical protein
MTIRGRGTPTGRERREARQQRRADKRQKQRQQTLDGRPQQIAGIDIDTNVPESLRGIARTLSYGGER